MRVAAIALSVVLLAACDTMIAHGIRITAVPSANVPGARGTEVAQFVRDTLSAHGLRKDEQLKPETWAWRDPNNPPGLRATVIVGEDFVQVRLSQGLFGPIGETPKYSSVKKALIEEGKARFGSKSVQVG